MNLLKPLYTNDQTQFRVSNLMTGLFLVGFSAAAFFFPEIAEVLLVKDFPGGAGAVEQFTELFLFLGLLLATPVLIKHWKRISDPVMVFWFAGWLLATFYFLGEEVSWGQWWFGWDTPEAWAEFNRQGETNLHNVSSWFSEKPRLLIELFIYGGGCLIPLAFPKLRRGIGLRPPLSTWTQWILPANPCIAPAAFLLFGRTARLFFSEVHALDFFADGEFREMAIAWFFLWYLLGLCRKTLSREMIPANVV